MRPCELSPRETENKDGKSMEEAEIGGEDFLEMALEEEHESGASKTSCANVKAKQSEAEYTAALAAQNLRPQDLTAAAIVGRTSSVLIGFATSFIYIQVAGFMKGTKTWQMAAMSLSVALLILAAQRFYLSTVGKASFAMNPEWAKVWMPAFRIFTIIIVFLAVSFGFSIFKELTETSQLSGLESIALIYVTLLSFFYLAKTYSMVESSAHNLT